MRALPHILILVTLPVLLQCEKDRSPDYTINLNSYPAYLIEGHHAGPASKEVLSQWLLIPGNEQRNNRGIRINSLNIPDLPSRSWPHWEEYPARDFTIVIPFALSAEELEALYTPALHLARIGERWRVLLNGREAFSNLEESYAMSRSDFIQGLDVRHFREGENQLTIQISGDPSSIETGLYYGGPYRITEYSYVVNKTSEAIDLSLVALYLAIGLFHMLFYIQKTKDRYNLFFGLFSSLMALWLFCRTTIIYQLIPYYSFSYRLEILAVMSLVPVFAAFIQTAQGGVHRWMIRVIGAVHVLLLMLVVLPLHNLIHDVVAVWRFTTVLFMLYFMVIIPMRFWRYVRLFRIKLGMGRAFQRALFNTVPGNILVGSMIVALAGLYDIAHASQGRGNVSTIGYAFLIFVSGSAFRIANRLVFLNETVDNLNRRLRQNIVTLNRTNARLSTSERRYRHLIDGSRDIILSLDENGIITLASRAARAELGLGSDELEGRRIDSLIHSDAADQFRTLEFFRERFEVFQREKESLQMKIPVRGKRTGSSGQFQLTLQKMRTEEGSEILGRMVPLREDYLLQFLDQEQLTFSLGNELFAVEELSQRLVRNLTRYTDSSEAAMIRIGLREILINAIEHGNLGITYEDKSRELSTGNYSEFIAIRQSNPDYMSRTVTVDYSLDGHGVIYRIRDEGDGFDHQSMPANLAVPESGDLPLHGRGIMITRNAFDLVEYSRRGNEVRLVKYFR